LIDVDEGNGDVGMSGLARNVYTQFALIEKVEVVVWIVTLVVHDDEVPAILNEQQYNITTLTDVIFHPSSDLMPREPTEHVDVLFHFQVAIVKPERTHVLVGDVYQCHCRRHVGAVPVKRPDEARRLDRHQL
jgi:hypothetical protein